MVYSYELIDTNLSECDSRSCSLVVDTPRVPSIPFSGHLLNVTPLLVGARVRNGPNGKAREFGGGGGFVVELLVEPMAVNKYIPLE